MSPQQIRNLFPITQRRAYLFSGGISPVSIRHDEAINRHVRQLRENPGDFYMNELNQDAEECRAMFAHLMGCDQDEVALVENTSVGCNIAFDLIELPMAGNVVFDQYSYPSSVLPWFLPARVHIEKKFVRPREDGILYLDDFKKSIDSNTVAVCISHVTQKQGFRNDLASVAEVAHENGAVIIVDGAQSAGAMSIDLHEIEVDFFSTTAMKWLLGAAGVGFLYIARRHHSKLPSHAGYRSANLRSNREFEWNIDARKFEIGMPNLLGLAISRVGLKILAEANMKTIENHNLDLSGYCIEQMKTLGLNVITSEMDNFRMGIVAIRYERSHDLWQFLFNIGIDTWCHDNLFRADSHVFNKRDDIDRLLDGVRQFLRST